MDLRVKFSVRAGETYDAIAARVYNRARGGETFFCQDNVCLSFMHHIILDIGIAI
jgi:hypothetical protein